MEKGLAKVREAHWRAVATMATLEEEIEQLNQSEAHAHSRSQDCCRQRSWGWKRMHCQVQLEESHAPYFEYHPPWRGLESKEDEEAPMDFNSARVGTGGQQLLPGASQKLRGGGWEDILPRTPSGGVGELGDLESLDV